jgi:hypothetical protein
LCRYGAVGDIVSPSARCVLIHNHVERGTGAAGNRDFRHLYRFDSIRRQADTTSGARQVRFGRREHVWPDQRAQVARRHGLAGDVDPRASDLGGRGRLPGAPSNRRTHLRNVSQATCRASSWRVSQASMARSGWRTAAMGAAKTQHAVKRQRRELTTPHVIRATASHPGWLLRANCGESRRCPALRFW